MQLFRQCFFACSLFLCVFVSFAKQSSPSIIGKWETIDDRSGDKKAVVVLGLNQNKLEGRIEKVYWKSQQNHLCIHCHGAKKNQAIEGMRFLWNLRQISATEWVDGFILDPHNGKIYRVNIKQQGDILMVRAYLGIALLGRTQKWHRYLGDKA